MLVFSLTNFQPMFHSYNPRKFEKPEVCNFIKQEVPTQAFSCEFRKNFQNTYFTEQLRWWFLSSITFKTLKNQFVVSLWQKNAIFIGFFCTQPFSMLLGETKLIFWSTEKTAKKKKIMGRSVGKIKIIFYFQGRNF